MRSGRTPPYIRPKSAAIQSSLWRHVGKGDLQDGQVIDGWDQNLTITATRMIEVEFPHFDADRYTEGARMALIPTWWSDGTGLRGRGEAQEIVIEAGVAKRKYDIALTIPGTSLARNVQLRAALVLVEPTKAMLGQALSPHRPGSVLWEDAISLRLDGDAPRFPISVVDFVDNQLGSANACWRFDWSPADPTLPAMATMRLLVNARQKAFHAAVTSREPTPAQVAIRSALKFALGEEMLRLALDHAQELEQSRRDFMPDSGGQVLIELVQRIYPGMGPVMCADRRRECPGEFAADVQARLALFGEKALLEDAS